jgi:uncharacterized membrane protein YphA (DoxX/SURF4 family)
MDAARNKEPTMNPVHQHPSPAAKTRNALLWTAQILWGVFFAFTGFGKVLALDPAIWRQMLHQVAWFSAVPQGLFVFIGICEGLGGVALIVPAVTRIAPRLIPAAAAGLALIMVLAAGFHIARGEYSFFLPVNLVLGGVAALIAWGRSIRPIAPARPGALRLLAATAVFAALICGGFAPVLYQTRLH